MNGWKECFLSEITDLVPGYAFKGEHFGEVGERVIKIKDITPPIVNVDNASRVDLSHYSLPKLEKFKLNKGDYVIAMTGATIGKVGRLISDQAAYINQRVVKVEPKDNADENFVYFSLIGAEFDGFVQNNIDSHSAQENISGASLGRYPIQLPPLPEQKAIAAVLSSLDDKIDLLHRQNKTLEALAETLFRQWFVEEAQEDWAEGPLSEFVDIGIGRTPPRKEHQWFSETSTDVKWISIKDMGNAGAYIFKTSEYLTKDAVERFNVPVIPNNTIVLSFKMTVGRVAITTETMLSNEAIAHFKFNSNTPFTVEYLYLFLKNFRYDSLGSTSSIVTAINSAMIKEMTIRVPDSSSMRKFDGAASALFHKIRGNQMEISTLERLRDTLLPKLMSGEVRVAC